jgi:hypothetical protein
MIEQLRASPRDFEHFVAGVAEVGLSEVDKAIAFLWYEDHQSPGVALSSSELAERLHSARLTGVVNVARLKERLTKSRATIKSGRGRFRIALKKKPELDEHFLPLLKRRTVKVTESLLPESQTKGTRPYIEKLAYQINGCYDSGFYDGCAVICRRLVESLLIDAFENAGYRSAIEKNGNLMGLDDILKQAKGGQHIKLPRGTPKVLEKIKEIGDTAAHDRTHITTEQDIAEFRSGFRKTVSQLLSLAGISPSK